jgi:hypothetical protein
MKTVFRIDVSDHQRQIIHRVGCEMGMGEYRGYALFDDSNYTDYPNPKWRKRALHLDVRRGVEEISPEHILKLINAPDCEHLVWLSKAIAESEQVHMIWVYAHELRHVIQSSIYPELSEMTVSLRNALRNALRTGYQLDLPQEFDAELAARDIVVKFFGEAEYQAYRCRQVAGDPKAAEYFRRFEELESNWSGDPIADTRRMILRVD